MSDTPFECPECSRRLTGRSCRCGWAMTETTDKPTIDTCERCGTSSKSVSLFNDEEARSEDRGRRLCGGCWIPALKRRATCDHEWAKGKRDGEKCAACEGIVSDLRQQFREYGDKIEARSLHL